MLKLRRIARISKLYLLVQLVLSATLLGCSPRMAPDAIGGNYYVSAIAGRTYIYKKESNNESVVIGEQILGLSSDKKNAFLKRLKLEEYECTNAQGKKEIVSINSKIIEYWIIDFKADKEYGPYDRAGYEKHSREKVGHVVEIKDTYSNDFNGDRSMLDGMSSCQTI